MEYDTIEPPADDMSRITARLFDYSWDDINAEQQAPVDEAIAAGYSQDEIDAFLGRSGLQDRLANDLAYRTQDPQFASGLRAPSESIPLTPMDELPSWRIGQFAGKPEDYTPPVDPLADYIEPPTSEEDQDAHARESYANALLRGDAGTPHDFSQRYAGALWGAASEADPGSLVRGAAQLSASLPSDEDFTDQAIAIARSAEIEVGPLSPEAAFARNASFTNASASSDFSTTLPPDQEQAFRQWVQANNVPFNPDAEGPQDYDMRGFYQGLMSGDPHAETGTNANDGQLHYSDYWKTPYHNSFSAESRFANGAAPSWNEQDQLVTPDGRIVFDERAGPNQVRTIKERLVDHWAETGEPLMETYRQAQIDADFKESLTAPPPEQPDWLDQFGTGARDMYGGMRRLAVEALPESFISTIDDVNKSIYEATGISQMPLTGAAEIEKGRLAMLSEAGDDSSWWRWGGQVAATLPIFTTLGLSGAWAMVAAGATGAAAAAAFSPSTSEDYWSDKAREVALATAGGAALGGVLHGAGRAIAAMAPEAAAVLRRAIASMDEPKIKVLDPGAEVPAVEMRASEALTQPAAAERAPVTISAGHVQGELPIVRFMEDARAIEASLPAAEEGHTRLWRGNRPGEIGNATQFTNSLPGIALPFREPYGGNVSYVDVATADLAKFVRTGGVAPGAEFSLPANIAAAAREVKVNPLPTVAARAERAGPQQFALEAPPIAKMGALARDSELGMTPPREALAAGANRAADLSTQVREASDDFSNPNFFRNLAAGQDAPTTALAEGMDGARNVGNYLADLGGRLMRDESGALNLANVFSSPEKRLKRAISGENRDFVQELMMKGMGANTQQLEHYIASFTNDMQRLLNKHMPEYEAEIAKGPMGAPMDTFIGDTIRYMGGRSAGITMKADNPFSQFADTIRAININLRGHMEDAFARGLHTLDKYYDDYFRQLWKDPLAADKAFGVGRQGSANSFKHRELTFEEGLARGLEPKFPNPMEMTIYDASEKLRYLRTLEMLDDAQNAKGGISGNPFVYYGASAKPGSGDVRLKGLGSEKDVATTATVGAQRALVQARAARDTLAQQVRVGGATQAQLEAARAAVADAEKEAAPKVFKQFAWANPGFAKHWNENINTGFFSREGTGKVYEQLLYFKNLQTQGQLMLPLFHAKTMVTEATAGGFANMVTELTGSGRFAMQGEWGKAGEEIARAMYDGVKTALLPWKWIETLYRGDQGTKAWRAMQQGNEVLDLMVNANARFGKRQDMYRFGSAPTLWESWQRGSFKNEYREAFRKWAGDPKTEPPEYRMARAATTRMFGFVAHEVGRLLNSSSAPLLDYVIPRLKTGVNMERLSTYLRQNPTATYAQKLAKAREIVNNTDDRMGEMNMENIFWPKTAKQMAQLSMISPGWVYGNARMLTNAIGMNMEKGKFIPFTQFNPTATTGIIGLTMAFALENSLYTLAMTGEMPKDAGDVFIGGATGAVINGVKERILMPSQVKEWFDFGKIAAATKFEPMSFPRYMGDYLAGKMPGLWQIARGIVKGKDAIGHDIGATSGGWTGFLLKNLAPIFAQQGAQRKQGTGIPEWQTFLGWRQTPKFAMDPEGFYKGLQYAADKAQKEEHYRAIAENKIYEQQREVPELPSTGRPGRLGRHYSDEDEVAGRKITRQRRGYGADLADPDAEPPPRRRGRNADPASDAALPPVFGQYGGAGRAPSRATGRSSRAPADSSVPTVLRGSAPSSRGRSHSRRRR